MNYCLPKVVNFVINAGADFSYEIEYFNRSQTPFNFTGYNVYAQLRKYPGQADVVNEQVQVYQFNASFGADPTLGKIFLSMPAAETQYIKEGRNTYDILIEYADSLAIQRIVQGEAIVQAPTTKLTSYPNQENYDYLKAPRNQANIPPLPDPEYVPPSNNPYLYGN